MKTLLDSQQLYIVLHRLAHQLVEVHGDFKNTVLVGIQPRGVAFSDRLVSILGEILTGPPPEYATLDTTFYRDDLRTDASIRTPDATHFPTGIDGKVVVLIDDVLYTGRTIRAAMDALLDIGRPERVELLTLIDRRLRRELPIQPNYIGGSVDTYDSQTVRLLWGAAAGEDQVYLVEDAS